MISLTNLIPITNMLTPFEKIGYKKKLDVCVPLRKNHLLDHIAI